MGVEPEVVVGVVPGVGLVGVVPGVGLVPVEGNSAIKKELFL